MTKNVKIKPIWIWYYGVLGAADCASESLIPKIEMVDQIYKSNTFESKFFQGAFCPTDNEFEIFKLIKINSVTIFTFFSRHIESNILKFEIQPPNSKSYWISHFLLRISKYRLQIRNQWDKKPPWTKFHSNQSDLYIFCPPYWIWYFEVWNSASKFVTNGTKNLVEQNVIQIILIFTFFDRHIKSDIWKFEIQPPNSKSADPNIGLAILYFEFQNTKFDSNLFDFYILFSILVPPFWNLDPGFKISEPKNPKY